ncbi:hypothetical protein [Herbaspirillum sp. RV1423]|uniref:hypothetical protein n=1 Tax=Herbaspirillum sp. RV1423 TaxID=1443993 RepID=UPI000554117A|nr:hypothetical protein [Herbaspirillum sp. RV1423]
MARPKRLNASDFASHKSDLPKGFEFLKGFRFHSIMEYTVDGRAQRRIEVLPTTLRRTIEHAAKVDQLERECAAYKQELKAQKNEYKKAIRIRSKELEESHVAILKNISDEKSLLENELTQIKSAHRELIEFCRQLEENNEKILANEEKEIQTRPDQRSPKNFFNKVDEGAKFKGLPMSGGLPSLGKRSR